MEKLNVSKEAYEYIENIRTKWAEVAEPINQNTAVVLLLHELSPASGLSL